MDKKLKKQLRKIKSNSDWINFLDNVLSKNTLDIEKSYEYEIEKLSYINSQLKAYDEELMIVFHDNLLNYFRVIVEDKNSDNHSIYVLISIFSEAKPIKSKNIEHLYNYVLTEHLIERRYGKTNLHCQLISSFGSFNYLNETRITSYLLKKLADLSEESNPFNLQFIDAALRFLIKSRDYTNYFNAFNLLLTKKIDLEIIELIDESINEYLYYSKENYHDLTMWYFQRLESLNYKKDTSFEFLDNFLVDWVNAENELFKSEPNFNLLFFLINTNILLPVKFIIKLLGYKKVEYFEKGLKKLIDKLVVEYFIFFYQITSQGVGLNIQGLNKSSMRELDFKSNEEQYLILIWINNIEYFNKLLERTGFEKEDYLEERIYDKNNSNVDKLIYFKDKALENIPPKSKSQLLFLYP